MVVEHGHTAVLLTDYTGTPTPYFGQTYQAHLK